MSLNKTYKIAITGGIGSGKTTVSNILREKGYNVYDADAIASQHMSQPEFKKKISKMFGLKVDANYNYDKKELAAKVFKDKESLALLNSVVHPPVIEHILNLMGKEKGISFAEIPLLFESKTEQLFDHVLIIKRDNESRVQSVMSRSGLTREQIEDRIKNQYDYEKKPKIEHTVIYNDCDLLSLNNKLGMFLDEVRKKTL